MSAQDAAIAEGVPSTSTGGVRDPQTALLNGVTHVERFVGPDGPTVMENPNLYDPNPGPSRPSPSTSVTAGGVFLGQVEPAYDGQPDPSANVITQAQPVQPARTPERRDMRRASTPASSVRVQEFYSAESTGTGDGRDAGGVRWMARFTEMLRTTATRGAHGLDRVLDNLGLNHQVPHHEGRMLRTTSSPVRFSPPEELPAPSADAGLQVPPSWTTTPPQEPLFGDAQMAQLRQAQRDYPQIYGYPAASEGDSERSSRLQAEVQRQLEEYTARYQTQISGLVREVQMLRAERDEWRARSVPRGIHEDPRNVPGDPTVPQGNPQHLPTREVAPLPVENQEPRNEPGAVQGDPTVPRGNPQHLPHGQYFYVHARGQESEAHHVHARGQESEAHHVTGGQESGHGEPHDPKTDRTTAASTTPQQWLGGQVHSQDAINLIAGGVAQLQAAMLKQMTTDRTGERTPETVKPGTTVLPPLPAVRSETASVDLLDWMELIEAPMSDLSDGSAGWWKQVRSKAALAYDKWVTSGPIERLSVTPEATEELEAGRWSRVNSRAASMVLTALDESIRSELVSRRMTGSVTAIVFRLLTLYQPGGEEEKYRTLQQLQSPPKESDPGRAVEALRAWNRWLRRCHELNIQPPDPSLQVRALNSVVKGVLERNSEASFRTNLVRSNLKIDSNPTKESVEKLYKHLMGECESMATSLRCHYTLGRLWYHSSLLLNPKP